MGSQIVPIEVTYIDNSMIAEYKRCPRRYYFRHVRDWTGQSPALALSFGTAWHQAMDGVWKVLTDGGTDKDALELGMAMFHDSWTSEGLPAWSEMGPEMNEEYSPRTPGVAAEMLYHYVLKRKQFIKECKLLAIERPFAVPIYPNREDIVYIGRLDKVVDRDGIWSIEHKTTTLYSKSQIFRESFTDSFSPNAQCDGQSHSLHMIFGDRVKGVMVDGALVHKQIHDGFKFIPVMRATAQLNSWLWDVREWIGRIRTDTGWSKEQQGRDYMAAFPKNDSACWDFGKPCPYLDVCRASANPADVEGPPPGMKVEKWEPFELKKLKEAQDGGSSTPDQAANTS